MQETTSLTSAERALVELGRLLRDAGYDFTTTTPASHARVIARTLTSQPTLRDVFGWSRAFRPDVLPARMLTLLDEAGALERGEDGIRSSVRFSTLHGALYVHSAYPTVTEDAVFFGPDSYRFVRLLREHVLHARIAIDVGTGSGVGGLSLVDRVERVVLTDVTERALSCAKVNAELAGVRDRVVFLRADVLAGVTERADLIVANPPYLIDAEKRSYRDGGQLGIELTIRIAREALNHLAGVGQLIIYSGAPIADGVDLLRRDVMPLMPVGATYEELDPDVFGEELASDAYATIDRIAAIALHVEMEVD